MLEGPIEKLDLSDQITKAFGLIVAEGCTRAEHAWATCRLAELPYLSFDYGVMPKFCRPVDAGRSRFILVNFDDTEAVIIPCGTNSVLDWFDNLKFLWSRHEGFPNSRVRLGFNRHAARLVPGLKIIVDELATDVSLHFVGHSLAGPISQILASEASSYNRQIDVKSMSSIGSPMAGDAGFARGINELVSGKISAYVHLRRDAGSRPDVFHMLPPQARGYRHPFKTDFYTISDDGVRPMDAPDSPVGLYQEALSLARISSGSVSAHLMADAIGDAAKAVSVRAA